MYVRRLHKQQYKVVAIAVVILLIVYYGLLSHDDSSAANFPKNQIKDYSKPKVIETFLLVLVLTGPKNKNRREAIRETWLAEAVKEKQKKSGERRDVIHYFVIGTKDLKRSELDAIHDEQSKYDDLLLLKDFADAYKKLTEKVGLTVKWVHDNIDFKYLFKGDDDTFARLDVIEEELKVRHSSKPGESLYYGYFYGRSHVKQSGPWKETGWKLCDFYLPYARGGGYILSTSVVSYVARNIHLFKQYLSEDVSMGAWLAPLEVERVHDIRFDTEYKTRGCSNTFVVSHKQTVDDMLSKHSSLQRNEKLCEKEVTLFHGYDYNWDVPPSQCCVRMTDIP